MPSSPILPILSHFPLPLPLLHLLPCLATLFQSFYLATTPPLTNTAPYESSAPLKVNIILTFKSPANIITATRILVGRYSVSFRGHACHKESTSRSRPCLGFKWLQICHDTSLIFLNNWYKNCLLLITIPGVSGYMATPICIEISC